MLHEIIPVGLLACNCSVVADDETNEAIVIDPGDEIERVQKILTRHDLKGSAPAAGPNPRRRPETPPRCRSRRSERCPG